MLRSKGCVKSQRLGAGGTVGETLPSRPESSHDDPITHQKLLRGAINYLNPGAQPTSGLQVSGVVVTSPPIAPINRYCRLMDHEQGDTDADRDSGHVGEGSVPATPDDDR